jgi:protein-tyrosine-phosphatase
MKQIYTTTLRLNLADEDDRRAFDYLQTMDKKQYRSYSKAIVAAVNDHFERQEYLAADPYLETREKEDAFLRRVLDAIEQGLRTAPAPMLPFAPPAPQATAPEPDDEGLSAALDFADSF